MNESLYYLQIFKSLLGLFNDVSLVYLKKINIVVDINRIVKEIDRRKRIEVLQKIFLEWIGCSIWEEVCDIFDDIFEKFEWF